MKRSEEIERTRDEILRIRIQLGNLICMSETGTFRVCMERSIWFLRMADYELEEELQSQRGKRLPETPTGASGGRSS